MEINKDNKSYTMSLFTHCRTEIILEYNKTQLTKEVEKTMANVNEKLKKRKT